MAQEYLPAPSNIRLADLMKEHNISQPELAKELGCSKSTINRFISGAKGTLTHEQVLKIARLFNVSTDFLLGETNIPDRKNSLEVFSLLLQTSLVLLIRSLKKAAQQT